MALIAYMPTAACASPGGAGQTAEPPSGATPFDRQGMWVWYVDRSEGGSIPRIVSRADRAGIGTLYVKSGDGGDYWSQFSSGLVESLHRAGLDVCAWQFVYGERPLAEAKVGAAAVRRGADCLVIDAEGQYEGRYASADRYVRALRARIGAGFPLSLAAFPYVDYHPSFPYSVFFGPEGATFNQPQMYWKAIGTSVRAVYEHTYTYNRLWGHPLYPLGQTYASPGRREVLRFRRFASSYGGLAPSWWDWQETSARTWAALGATTDGPLTAYRPVTSQPAAEARQPRRPGRLGAGAPGRRRPDATARDRDLRQADRRRGAGVPAVAGACGRRRDRHHDLERPAGRRAGATALGGAPSEGQQRRHGEPRGSRQPSRLRLASRQGLRDRSGSRPVTRRPAGALAGIAMVLLLALPAGAGAAGTAFGDALRVPRPGLPLDDVVLSKPAAGAARIAASASSQRYPIGDGSGATIAVEVTSACAANCTADDPQQIADFIGTLIHGPEVDLLTVQLDTPFQIVFECGLGAQACYYSGEDKIVLSGNEETTRDGASRDFVLAHEYGHHVAQHRHLPAPFGGAVDWGTERWVSRENVCQGRRHGRLYPGDEGEPLLRGPRRGLRGGLRPLPLPAGPGPLALPGGPEADPGLVPGDPGRHAFALAAEDQLRAVGARTGQGGGRSRRDPAYPARRHGQPAPEPAQARLRTGPS